jgi:FtsP/CotA-like multicopper oxidase with cupredoxin domain
MCAPQPSKVRDDDAATDPTGQLFFDIFTTDGFLGDIMLVNFQYAPFMEVLPRKYRFRTLSAGMSRFIQLQIADSRGNAVPFLQIAVDGNFFVSPISLTSLDLQGTAERYDIIVDFGRIRVGDVAFLVNTSQQTDGCKPDKQLPRAGPGWHQKRPGTPDRQPSPKTNVLTGRL